MELIKDELSYSKVTKKYTLEHEKAGKLSFYKWTMDDEDFNDLDSDFEWIDNANKEKFKALSEKEQNKIIDFINEIDLSKTIEENNAKLLGKPMPDKNLDANGLSHNRNKAIAILEWISEKLGNEYIFDNAEQKEGVEPDGMWYEFEDGVTKILDK